MEMKQSWCGWGLFETTFHFSVVDMAGEPLNTEAPLTFGDAKTQKPSEGNITFSTLSLK